MAIITPRMQGPEKNSWLLGRLAVFLTLSFTVITPACQRDDVELARLRTENQALRTEVENLKRQLTGTTSTTAGASPTLDLTIDELWAERFADNRFRAKQLLDGKVVRLTGAVDSVGDTSVAITGHSARVGTINVLAKLEQAYATRVHDQLANIERGREVTLEGNFVFDKMWLENARFVERKSGKETAPQHTPSTTQAAPEPTAVN